MTTLALQQQALLTALLEWPPQAANRHLSGLAKGVGAHPERGLKAYLANGHGLAERALQAAYPVLDQMLGHQSFAELARAYWHACPPLHGDIGVWGAQLADFIVQSPQLQCEAYLPDVAKAEWALHRCATACDRDIDLATLSLLTTENPQILGLVLAPGLMTVSSIWPLASLMLAHLEGNPTLEEVGQQLRHSVPQDVVIWRAGLQPRLRLGMAGETALLGALQAGIALEPALDSATGLDFSQWLPLAVRTGLLLGVSHIGNDSPIQGNATLL